MKKDPEDIVIGVDNGANFLFKSNLTPDILIGDMDSIDQEALDYFKAKTTTHIYNRDKNETDTELALRWCVSNSISEVVIVNSLSGRFDHSLGILSNLILANKYKLNASIYSANHIVYLCNKKSSYIVSTGDIVSLMPLTERVEGVATQGLKYPLDTEPLFQNCTRGLSNIAIDKKISISVKEGLLAVIITNKAGKL